MPQKSSFSIFKLLGKISLLCGAPLFIFILMVIMAFYSIVVSAMGSATAEQHTSRSTLSQETIALKPQIEAAAAEYGISDYVPILLAICNQESRGIGNNPFQIAGDPPPASAEESIKRGVEYFAYLLDLTGMPAPKIESEDSTAIYALYTAIQCYNYGEGYYSYLKESNKGYIYYSEVSAQRYQEIMMEEYPDGYGDAQYVQHILQFWDPNTNTNRMTGMGSNKMVEVALSQVSSANDGGAKFWQYMGFGSRVPWCAAFISWCADQCGYIDTGLVEYTAAADPTYYIQREQYFTRSEGYAPLPGDLIYFDWEQDGEIDHVGIVEYVQEGIVYTIEGNSGDAVQTLSYYLNDPQIDGFACPAYF